MKKIINLQVLIFLFFVSNLAAQPKLTHLTGNSTWSFEIKKIDNNSIKNNNYKITISDSGRKLNLINLTTGANLLTNHPLPDTLSSNMPVTDGFKIMCGKYWGEIGIKKQDMYNTDDPALWGWNWTAGTRFLTWAGSTDSLHLESYQGALGYSNAANYFNSIAMPVSPANLPQVELRFANTTYDATTNTIIIDSGAANTNMSYAYRYVRGGAGAAAKPEFAKHLKRPWNGSYGWNDYEKTAALSAWDMDSKAKNPTAYPNGRRLAIGYLENNVAGGLLNGYYSPGHNANYDNTASSGPREWLWISNRDYSDNGKINPLDTLSALSSPMQYMYFATWQLRNTNAWKSTDRLLISPHKTLTENDSWTFNPTIMGLENETTIPFDYKLFQNFPNPFNPTTTIKYQIANKSLVKIQVFNVLGQKIDELLNDIQTANKYEISWNGNNYSSGVYFYRVNAVDLNNSSNKFTSVKKMILMK